MMLLGCDDRDRWLRVALATIHVPLREVSARSRRSKTKSGGEGLDEGGRIHKLIGHPLARDPKSLTGKMVSWLALTPAPPPRRGRILFRLARKAVAEFAGHSAAKPEPRDGCSFSPPPSPLVSAQSRRSVAKTEGEKVRMRAGVSTISSALRPGASAAMLHRLKSTAIWRHHRIFDDNSCTTFPLRIFFSAGF